MKRVGKSEIETATFLNMPVIITLNGKPAAVLVPMPLVQTDVEQTAEQLAELVKEQKDES